MSEMITSAIVGEAVSRVFSTIISRHEDGSDEAGDSLERLEMAHIKMEAAVETSSKWQITHAPLLRWRNKLKRAAEECEEMLRGCKQRALEDQETKEQVRQYSFPRRVAHATKSLVSSFIDHSNAAECSTRDDTVQRFERLAEGATEFLNYVQLGGAVIPRQYLFFDPLIRHLFAGEFLEYQTMRHGSQYHYFGPRPMSFEERGLEAMLSFIYEDCEAPHKSFRLGFMLRLSESTDIIGITVECLQLVTPHFKSTAEIVVRELTQLPTQDFSWSSQYDPRGSTKHWNNVHNTLTRWFRPDPLCCQAGYEQPASSNCSSRRNGSAPLPLSSIFPEPVSEVFFQRHISASDYYGLQGSFQHQEGLPPLKLGVLFIPHDSSCVGDLNKHANSSAVEAIDGEKQQRTHVDVHPHQLDEMLIPKAIEHLYSNTGATMHQVSWKSRHGSAHLCVERTKAQPQTVVSATRRVRRQGVVLRNKSSSRKPLQTEDQIRKEQWKQVAADFLKLMAVRTSDRLQGSITKWLDMP